MFHFLCSVQRISTNMEGDFYNYRRMYVFFFFVLRHRAFYYSLMAATACMFSRVLLPFKLIFLKNLHFTRYIHIQGIFFK